MTNASLEFLFGLLLFLMVASAYFSSSETAMMSLNRYRLRHLAKRQHAGASRASKLLEKPDRLIGIILIGNNFVNFLASSIGTIIAIRLFGPVGGLISPVILTLVFLIFAEVTPKTFAALKPELIAYPSSLLLGVLLRVFHPMVWLINTLSNGVLRLFGINLNDQESHHLTSEELRTVVDESGARIPARRQNMLLNILDLEKVTVNDIMVPRNDVTGINIEHDIDKIKDQLINSQHTRLPVYKHDLNDVIGILHIRNAARFLNSESESINELLELTRSNYFVPDSTPLHTQLLKFQQNKRRIAMVVDEYGEFMGIVTLEDILEEIVGNFTTNLPEETASIHPQLDGTFLIDGTATIREINRTLGWNLPTDGPRTLSGLLTEILETIPGSTLGVRLPHHFAEIVQVKDNLIKTVRMWPHSAAISTQDDKSLQPSLFDDQGAINE